MKQFILLFVSTLISQGYSFEIKVDTSKVPDLAEAGKQVKLEMEQIYNDSFKNNTVILSEPFDEPTQILFKFVSNLWTTNAYTYPKRNIVLVNADTYRLQSPTQNMLMLVHELIHVLQQYKKSCPGWIYEGLADLWTYTNTGFYRHKPTKPLDFVGEHYTEGYDFAAYFLRWIEEQNENVKDGKSAIHFINKACREGTYTDSLITELTGKTFEENWKQMIYDPKLIYGSLFPKFEIWTDVSEAQDLEPVAENIRQYYLKWYKPVRDLLYSPTYEELDEINVDFESTSETDGNQVMTSNFTSETAVTTPIPGEKTGQFSAEYYRKNPNDMQSTMYTLSYIIQQHRPSTPTWLSSGIAEWVKDYKTGSTAAPRVPSRKENNYTDGYWATAYFLNWLDDNFKPQQQRMTYWLNRSAREGNYNDTYFKTLTGKTVKTLWGQMIQQIEQQKQG